MDEVSSDLDSPQNLVSRGIFNHPIQRRSILPVSIVPPPLVMWPLWVPLTRYGNGGFKTFTLLENALLMIYKHDHGKFS